MQHYRYAPMAVLLTATLLLSSCQTMEHVVNQVWGQDERPVVDKTPYQQRRRPAANPQSMSEAPTAIPDMLLQPGAPSMHSAGGGMPVQGAPIAPPLSALPMPPSGGMPDIQNSYAPLNTMPDVASEVMEKGGFGGDSLKEMSKEFEDIKGGKVKLNPYAKYKELRTEFEPMASDWVVTKEEPAVAEFVEENAPKKNLPKKEKTVSRNQSMFPLSEYSPEHQVSNNVRIASQPSDKSEKIEDNAFSREEKAASGFQENDDLSGSLPPESPVDMTVRRSVPSVAPARIVPETGAIIDDYGGQLPPVSSTRQK